MLKLSFTIPNRGPCLVERCQVTQQFTDVNQFTFIEDTAENTHKFDSRLREEHTITPNPFTLRFLLQTIYERSYPCPP